MPSSLIMTYSPACISWTYSAPNTSIAHVSLAKMYAPFSVLPTTSGRIALGSTAPYNASFVSIAKVKPPLI